MSTKLKDLRLERGFSQQALADAAACSKGTVAMAERGAAPAVRAIRVTLAQALGVTPEELFGEVQS